MTTFVLVDFGLGPHWRRKVNDKIFNSAGGYCLLSDATTVLDEVEAEDWEDLDYSRTDLVVNTPADSMEGWLSPDGRFHPVQYGQHDVYAYYVLKQEVYTLEQTGWVRCHAGTASDPVSGPWFVKRRGRLTAEQRNTLVRRGYRVEDSD